MVQIFSPADLFSDERDVSCIGSLHLLLRDSQLICITQMRSQAALKVLPSDLFVCTMLHEAAAIALGVTLGVYHHFAGSFHFYSDEIAEVARLQSERRRLSDPMPPMTSSAINMRPKLLDAERDIRLHLETTRPGAVNVAAYGLDIYWTGLLQALVLSTKLRMGLAPTGDDIRLTPRPYRECLLTAVPHA
jgi:hypothetical protein